MFETESVSPSSSSSLSSFVDFGPIAKTSAALLCASLHPSQTHKALRILRACPFLAWHTSERYRRTVHAHAAFAGNLDVLRALVDLNPAAALIRDYDGDDALKLASIRGYVGIVEFLVARVPLVCASDDIWTSLVVLERLSGINVDHIVRIVAGARDRRVLDLELSAEHWRFAERVLRVRPELAPFLEKTLRKAVQADNPELVMAIVDPAQIRAVFLDACACPAPKVMMALVDLGSVFDPEAQTLAAVHPAHIVGPVFRRVYTPCRILQRQLGV